MFLKRKVFPEESEIVLCTVTSVHHHTVFVRLDEYGKTGIINIAEISPGRIRNIRDYVVEGKKIVCKVLNVNLEREHIDLSLRRVTESQKRNKSNEIKQEQKVQKIIQLLAEKEKLDAKDLIKKIAEAIPSEYPTMSSFFDDIVAGEANLDEVKFDKKILTELVDAIKQRIKPSEVIVNGELQLESNESDGISIIKESLKKAIEVDSENITILYIGAGRYKIKVKAPDYKKAESVLKESTETAISYVKKKKGSGEFIREEKHK